MVYPTYFKSLKEGQGKAVEGYLPDQHVFVYLRTRSELLRDPDRLRGLSLDLSKTNRAVPAVCEWPSFFSTKKGHRSKFASTVSPTSPCWKHSSVDERLLGTALLFSAVLCHFDSQRYLIKSALQNKSSPRLIPSSLVNSDSCRYKLHLHKPIAFVWQFSGRLKQIIQDRFKHGFVFSGGVNQWKSFCNLSADYMLHCTQINSFEWRNSNRKRFDGNHFLLSRRSRAEHMKSEKCQSWFSRQKFTLWLTFLQVKQVDLSRLTSLALALATSSHYRFTRGI